MPLTSIKFFHNSAVATTAEEEEIEAYKKKTRLDESGEFDLMSILGADVMKVGTTNPVKDFSLLLETGKKPVQEVYGEMEKVIIELLKDSGGTNQPLMAKVQSCLEAYREHALAKNRAVDFNLWMMRFKEHAVGNYFSDFWQKYVSESRLGLITKEESSASTVDKQQAEQFIHLPTLNESLESLDEDEELVRPRFVNVRHARWPVAREMANKLDNRCQVICIVSFKRNHLVPDRNESSVITCCFETQSVRQRKLICAVLLIALWRFY